MKFSKEIKAGILVVVSIAVFIFGFNFLKGKNFFSERRVFYAIYPNVAGIVEANPVQLNGFKVGRVKDIQLLGNNGKIIITIAISDTKLNIPKNTVAKIVSSTLLGDKAIQLIPSDSKEFANDGDTLIGSVEESLQASVNATVQPLKIKAEKLIGS